MDRKVNYVRYPMVLSGVVAVVGLAFLFRRSLIGDMTAQREAMFKNEDQEGQELLKQAIIESWATNKIL